MSPVYWKPKYGTRSSRHRAWSKQQAKREADQAKAVCRECAVQESCLEHALGVREKDGVWGGRTERERRRIIRQRRRTA